MIKMKFNENELLTDCNTLIQPGDAVTAQATRDQQHGHQAGEGATLAAHLPLRSTDAVWGAPTFSSIQEMQVKGVLISRSSVIMGR